MTTDRDSDLLPERRYTLKRGGSVIVRPCPKHLPFGRRGERPIVWYVDGPRANFIKSLQIPGVLTDGSRIEHAWDAAPVVAAYLGEDAPKFPSVVDIPFPGLGRYKELGLHKKARPYQPEAISFVAARSYSFLSDDCRCISGDAILVVNRGGNGKRTKLSHLVYKLNGGISGNNRTWDLFIDTYVQSMNEEGILIKNRVAAVHELGVKQVLELSVGDKVVKATAEHKFLTSNGWSRLEELREGDEVALEFWPKHKPKTERPCKYNFVEGLHHQPFAAKREYVTPYREAYGRIYNPILRHHARVLKHRLVVEASMNNLDYQDYILRLRSGDLDGFMFLQPDTLVHHKNGDTQDNRLENLEAIGHSEHSRLHALEGAWKHVCGRVEYSKVLSVRSASEESVYDLTVESPHNNYVANGFIVSNSGKTFDAISATVLCDAKKVLVSTLDSVKRVWAEEIVSLTGEEAVILYGRAANECRVFCKVCMGRGRVEQVQNQTEIDEAKEARAAKPDAKRPRKIPRADHRCPGCRAANGQALGMRICTGEEVRDAIAAHRYILCNPDLLIAQKAKTLPGVEYVDRSLPGWCPTLAGYKFDWFLIDESHTNRSWQRGDRHSGSTSKRERMIELSENIERVTAISATPMVGFVRDFWTQLDLISKGLWGSDRDARMPWWFAASYSGGGKKEDGFWQWDGKTERADTELFTRLKSLKIQRGIEELAKDMPPITRQVIRVDTATAKADKIRRKDETTASTFKRLIRRAGDYVRPVVIENVLNEMAAGRKSVVFHKCEESVETFAKRLHEEMWKRSWAPRMRQVRGEIWAVHGDFSSGKSSDPDKPLKGGSEKMRYEGGRMFREHRGAACFVASIDAFQVGLSLKGATTIHFPEYHESPGCMFQAERRPREIGTTGLTIIYYLAQGTIHDRLEVTLLPKVAAMEAMRQDKGAGEMLEAFGLGKQDDAIDLDTILAELCERDD